MADTLQNIKLPANQWVDLYSETGIAAGTAISVENIGSNDVYVTALDSQPPVDYDAFSVARRQSGDDSFVILGKDSSGAWAQSPHCDGKVNIKVVSVQSSIENTVGEQVPSTAIQFMDNIAFVDHFGQLVVGEMISRISVNFAYGRLDDQFDVMPPITQNGGVVSAVNQCAEVSTSAVGDLARLDSRNFLRYSNGRGFFGSFTASFEGIGTGTAGLCDDNDGFCIKANTTGAKPIYKFVYIDNGIIQGEVDMDIEGLDMSNLNIFNTLGGFLGVANPTLFVKMDVWKPIAIIKTEGRLDNTHVGLPAFPMRIEARDGMTIKSGSWHAGTIGEAARTQDRGFSLPNYPFSGAGGDNPVTAPQGRVTVPANSVVTLIVIRSKLLYNGFPNKIAADVVNYEFAINPPANSDGVAQFQLIGNPTIAGSVFQDVSPSSVLDYDSYDPAQGGGSTGQYDVDTSGGIPVGLPVNIPYSGAAGNQASPSALGSIEVDQFDLDGLAGETLALVCRNIGGDDIDVFWTLTWIERQI